MNDYHSNLMFVNMEWAIGKIAIHLPAKMNNLLSKRRKLESIKKDESDCISCLVGVFV